jgi:hypothetical protein
MTVFNQKSCETSTRSGEGRLYFSIDMLSLRETLIASISVSEGGIETGYSVGKMPG